MKKLSLKWQISFVGIVPFFASMAIVASSLYTYINNYKRADQIEKDSKLVFATSSAVQELQKERGLTAGFLSGSIPSEQLEQQRSKTTEQFLALVSLFDQTSFDQKLVEELKAQHTSIDGLRKRVTSKQIETKEAISTYTSTISLFLGLSRIVAQNSIFPNLSSGFFSLAVIESAKESGGKLRANMTSVLSGNQSIPVEMFSLLLDLKAGVEANLKSPALNLNVAEKNTVDDFFHSAEWHDVGVAFRIILQKSGEGNYNQDPKVFFGTITKALDKLITLNELMKKTISEDLQEIRATSRNGVISMLALAIGLALLLTALIYFMVRSITRHINDVAEQITEGSSKVLNTSKELSAVSHKLSEGSIEQAASLQETTASADEISAMADKNAQNAKQATVASKQSEDAALQGQEIMEKMVSSIQEISSHNAEVFDQMNKTNQDIREVAAIIKGIGEKTKVINEIVFQTKLLSFNASVEAARAGEHGKGFAVVAEEVGSLAQMSGNAANEISSMLEASIGKVGSIVEATISKVETLKQTTTEKISSGLEIAQNCQGALDKILQMNQEVSSFVTEISQASGEQSQGVKEISKAMVQMDQVTQQNSGVAQQSSNFAETLNVQAEFVNKGVNSLKALLLGQGSVPASSEAHDSNDVANNSSKDDHLKSEDTENEKVSSIAS